MTTADKFYALRESGRASSFSCVALTEEGFDRKIQLSFNNAKGIRRSGTGGQYTMEDFLEGWEKVKVSVEILD